MKHLIRLTALTVVAVGATLSLGVAPVQAASPNTLIHCETSNGDFWFSGYCEGTQPSAFRAVIHCTDDRNYYGQWEYAGGSFNSTAYCPVNRFYSSGKLEFAAA
jgi:hypothetical protein